MKVLIIEDEQLAADRLQQIIEHTEHSIEVKGVMDTIRDSVGYLEDHQASLDLIFCDIHLADGLSFEIFKQIEVDVPVIFTTAYDEYSIDAFKVNSIDYLLKPIKAEEVAIALNKYQKFHQNHQEIDNSALKSLVNKIKGPGQKRFLVKSGIKLIPKKMEEIGLVFIENKVVQFHDFPSGKAFMLDFSLDDLMSKELDPDLFFRINRKQIVNIEAIEEIKPYFNQRLSLTLKFPTSFDLIVSREKVNDFKKWFVR